MVAFLELIRGHHTFWAWITMMLIVEIAGRYPPVTLALLSSLSIACVAAGGYSLNDYYDLEIDRVNFPKRPLPSGRLHPVTAVRVSVACFTLGIFLAVLCAPGCALVALVDTAVLVAYNRVSKRIGWLKTAAVCWLLASIFVFAAFAIGRADGILVMAGLYTVFSTFYRECIKDAHDEEGDRLLAGARTPATILGKRRLKAWALGSLAVAVLLAPVAYAAGVANPWMLLLLPLAGAVLFQASRQADALSAARWLTMGAYFEIWAILFGFNY